MIRAAYCATATHALTTTRPPGFAHPLSGAPSLQHAVDAFRQGLEVLLDGTLQPKVRTVQTCCGPGGREIYGRVYRAHCHTAPPPPPPPPAHGSCAAQTAPRLRACSEACCCRTGKDRGTGVVTNVMGMQHASHLIDRLDAEMEAWLVADRRPAFVDVAPALSLSQLGLVLVFLFSIPQRRAGQ
jgi:hypothetical protein